MFEPLGKLSIKTAQHFSYRKFVPILIAAIVVSIFSFPELDFEYSTGVDPPLKWLFNKMFTTDLSLGEKIIFPHGPLAFLMYPLAENFIIATIVTISLQVVFTILLFRLFNKNQIGFVILAAAISWFIISISNFNQLILSNVLLAYLLDFKSANNRYKYWGFLLTSTAFYVKAYVAIISGAFTVSFLVIQLIRNRDFRYFFYSCFIVIASMIAFWVIMFRNVSGFLWYCIGIMHLAGDNSAAAAYNPANNWLLLVPSLLIVFCLPFFQKNKKASLFAWLFLPALFAGWKYGMAREDFFHYRILLFFVGISLLLFVIYNHKRIVFNLIASSIVILLLALNIRNTENSQALSINYSGIKNFADFVTSYSEIAKKAEAQNAINIGRNKLPSAFRTIIGEKTADIYPWDYTMVKANDLNWKGRPVIQSYAAYTPWLDRRNATHFAGNGAPEFIAVGLNNVTADFNDGNLESIDNRYLLNDEPVTIIELIKHYQKTASNSDFLIWEKRKTPVKIDSKLSEPQKCELNKWIDVPTDEDHLIRLRLNIEKNFFGRLKSFLYKDELYFMYLKTWEGNILKYRIVPQNATDGIWITPFYLGAGEQSPPVKIKSVLVTCSNKNLIKESYTCQWEHFALKQEQLNNFLGKDSLMQKKLLFEDALYPDSINSNWEKAQGDTLVVAKVDGESYYKISGKQHSPVFHLNRKENWQSPMVFTVESFLKGTGTPQGTLVIEATMPNGEKLEYGIDIRHQIIDPSEFNHVSGYYKFQEVPAALNAFILNRNSTPLFISEIKVRLENN
jgi:hypothetical protein